MRPGVTREEAEGQTGTRPEGFLYTQRTWNLWHQMGSHGRIRNRQEHDQICMWDNLQVAVLWPVD